MRRYKYSVDISFDAENDREAREVVRDAYRLMSVGLIDAGARYVALEAEVMVESGQSVTSVAEPVR